MKRKHCVLYAKHTYISLFIMCWTSLAQLLNSYIVFFKSFYICNHPMYFILLLHMYSFIRLCKNTNQPSFKGLIGLSTGRQRFYAGGTSCFDCIANVEFKLPYRVSWTCLYCRIMTYHVLLAKFFWMWRFCLFFFFFANLLGLGLTSILPPLLYLYKKKVLSYYFGLLCWCNVDLTSINI
jgi:hypothetical protein